jgi:hypothetical protein
MRVLPLLLLPALACMKPPPTVAELPPQVTLYGVQVHTFRGSALASSGRAAKLTLSRDSYDFTADEALLLYPGSDPGRRVEVRAPRLFGHLPSQQVNGEGGVVARTGSGTVAVTEGARFDGVRQLASGDRPIDISGPGHSVKALRFNFDLATEALTFDGQVDSRLGGVRP